MVSKNDSVISELLSGYKGGRATSGSSMSASSGISAGVSRGTSATSSKAESASMDKTSSKGASHSSGLSQSTGTTSSTASSAMSGGSKTASESRSQSVSSGIGAGTNGLSGLSADKSDKMSSGTSTSSTASTTYTENVGQSVGGGVGRAGNGGLSGLSEVAPKTSADVRGTQASANSSDHSASVSDSATISDKMSSGTSASSTASTTLSEGVGQTRSEGESYSTSSSQASSSAHSDQVGFARWEDQVTQNSNSETSAQSTDFDVSRSVSSDALRAKEAEASSALPSALDPMSHQVSPDQVAQATEPVSALDPLSQQVPPDLVVNSRKESVAGVDPLSNPYYAEEAAAANAKDNRFFDEITANVVTGLDAKTSEQTDAVNLSATGETPAASLDKLFEQITSGIADNVGTATASALGESADGIKVDQVAAPTLEVYSSNLGAGVASGAAEYSLEKAIGQHLEMHSLLDSPSEISSVAAASAATALEKIGEIKEQGGSLADSALDLEKGEIRAVQSTGPHGVSLQTLDEISQKGLSTSGLHELSAALGQEVSGYSPLQIADKVGVENLAEIGEKGFPTEKVAATQEMAAALGSAAGVKDFSLSPFESLELLKEVESANHANGVLYAESAEGKPLTLGIMSQEEFAKSQDLVGASIKEIRESLETFSRENLSSELEQGGSRKIEAEEPEPQMTMA